MDINGKTIVVTGGTRGIGAAIAEHFYVLGANLIVTGTGASGTCDARRMYLQGDVSAHDDAGRVIKAARERFGTVDVLINNAGITRDALLLRMTESDFDAVISVNLKGAFNMTKHAAAVMLKQRRGAIINITSVSGLCGNVGQANYAASKAGLIGLTKTTAKELASRGITCNAIAPGAVTSDMTESLSPEVRAQMLAKIPLGRFAMPGEIAAAAAFLVSAPYITGHVLTIDGGMTLL